MNAIIINDETFIAIDKDFNSCEDCVFYNENEIFDQCSDLNMPCNIFGCNVIFKKLQVHERHSDLSQTESGQ